MNSEKKTNYIQTINLLCVFRHLQLNESLEMLYDVRMYLLVYSTLLSSLFRLPSLFFVYLQHLAVMRLLLLG